MGRHNSREAVISAAITIFLRDGYAVNLDVVAKEAGVTRKTLYNLFGSKEALFRAVIAEMCQKSIVPVITIDEDGAFRDVLLKIAQRHLKLVCDYSNRAILRLAMLVAPQFPDLAQFVINIGAGQELDVLSTFLASKVETGLIACPDAGRAAERFYGSLMGWGLLRGLLGEEVYPASALPKICEEAVDAFIMSVALPAVPPGQAIVK